MQADGATELDCFEISGDFCAVNGVCVDVAFLEGFVVIKSPEPLDVVGVYTARHSDGEVETMDVDAVRERQISEAVELTAPEPKSEIKRHMEFPAKGSPAFGGKEQPK